MKSFISRLSGVFIAVSLLVFAACSSMTVHTAKAPDVDFSRYKTYSWYPGEAVELGEKKAAASILEQTIRASVDRQMMNKGLTPVSGRESADLLVSYSAISKASDRGAAYGNYGWDWGGLAPSPTHEGMLSLQIVDRRANNVVWTGTASDMMGLGDESQKQIARAVKDLFEHYPVI